MCLSIFKLHMYFVCLSFQGRTLSTEEIEDRLQRLKGNDPHSASSTASSVPVSETAGLAITMLLVASPKAPADFTMSRISIVV